MGGRRYGEEIGVSSILEGLVKVKGIARNEDFGVQ
jgi:hypothetical protein